MAHRTATSPPTAELAAVPPDIAVMRSLVRRLLAENAEIASLAEAETLTLQLRGHIQLLIPEVQAKTDRLPKDDIPRYCALACIGEARGKLRITPRPGLDAGAAYARRLARVVNALCDHHENLGGERRRP